MEDLAYSSLGNSPQSKFKKQIHIDFDTKENFPPLNTLNMKNETDDINNSFASTSTIDDHQKDRKNSSKTQNLKDSSTQIKQKKVDDAKFKTELCKNWIEKGSCMYNDKCKFAHGKDELIPKLNFQENYKKKICLRFHQNGYCPYGSRCIYIHNEKTQLTNNLKEQNFIFLLNNYQLDQKNKFGQIILNNNCRLPIFRALTKDLYEMINDKLQDQQ